MINPFEGDPGKQKVAAERAEAINEGTLPEFEARRKAGQEEIGGETRRQWTPEGRPEAAFLAEATQLKIRTGDPRSAQEIAMEMYRDSQDQEKAA